MENNDPVLRQILAELQAQKTAVSKSGIPYPTELNDPNIDPNLRAKILNEFSGRLMEIPQNLWSPQERAAVRESVDAVLAKGW